MNNYDYVSRIKRFLNWAIDGLVISIFGIVSFISIAPMIIKYGFFDWIEKDITYDLTFTILPIYLFYYLIFEGLFKTTIGKIITKTRLIKLNGERINFGNALTRRICRFIPFEQLSYLSKNPVGLHDNFSNTRLLNK